MAPHFALHLMSSSSRMLKCEAGLLNLAPISISTHGLRRIAARVTRAMLKGFEHEEEMQHGNGLSRLSEYYSAGVL